MHTASFEAVTSLSSDDGADLTIIGISQSADASAKDEVTAANLFANNATAQELDGKLGGGLSALIADDPSFSGKAGTCSSVVQSMEGGKFQKYVLLGLGASDKGEMTIKTSDACKVGSAIAKSCKDIKGVQTCTVILPSDPTVTSNLDTEHVVSTFYSDLYSDNRYRTGESKKFPAKDLKGVTIVMADADNTAASSIQRGKAMAEGIYLSKDIVNAPHNVLNSLSLANSAKRLADETELTTTILDKDACEARGMGSYLGVARGSETDPYFIHMVYTPKDGVVKRKLGVVGKGLLFDTGGYNIKTAMMELMKFDCGGAAAVFGAAKAIAALAPPGIEVHFCVAACENMINAKAYVPSDILVASNGKTIEVLNTDAEGRLTLADALVYADQEVGCDKIIELSTLTGSCIIALGKKYAGVFSKDDDLANELNSASDVTGDKTWRMPMPDEYNELLESKIADLKNIGTRWGGSITAALFLQNFVREGKPFAHIDIAGPVWDDGSGATGYGAKLVTAWATAQGE